MNKDLPIYKRFPYTIGELPTSFLMSMSYEEQLTWLCNYIQNKVNPFLESLQNQMSNWQELIDDLNSKIGKVDEIIEEFDKLKIEVELFQNTIIKDVNNRFTTLSKEIYDYINGEINKIYIYIGIVETRLEEKINNISLDNFKMINPLTGELTSINTIINILFDTLREDPITASEFDALELTATGFDSKEITAYDFDNNGKALLTN